VTVRRLSEAGNINSMPNISADGGLVIFVSDAAPNGTPGADIYVVEASGGKPRNLTNDLGTLSESFPRFSPDASQIAFQASSSATGSSIYLMNADGSNKRALVEDGSNNIRPIWSPDARYLAFTSDRTGKNEIFVVEVASGQVYQVTSSPEKIIATDWGR
jgi:TolB protein